jgi:cytosine deaminase
MTTSRLLKNARSPGWDSLQDILIEDGKIAQIGKGLKDGDGAVLDLEGRMVIPGLVEGHTHLDKALTLDLCDNKEGTLIGAIREMAKVKQKASVEDFYQRAEACLQKFISNGATTVRTHVDVDSSSELRGMEALVRLREAYRDKVWLQLVAFASGASGPLGEPQNKDRLTAAVDMGSDVVGGAPTLAEDPEEHINVAFELALERDLPIDMHIDESDNPDDRALELLAEKTMAEGYEGRVVAGHCCSLAAMDDAAAGRIIEKVAKARISVITMPFCNLYLQGRHDAQPIRRGLTRVKELEAAGVNVYCASDNVQDPFGPFGRADTLEAAWLTGLTAQLNPSLMTKILDMVTVRPARAVGLGETYGVATGCAADLVVMAAESVETVVIERPERVLVFKGGRIVSTGQGAAALGVSGTDG